MGSEQSEELVSIVVPAFRRPEYLRESLASVLDQTHAALEVLVGVDADDEASRPVAVAFAARDSRVRVEPLPRLRLPPKLNALVGRTRGRLVGVFSDDDVMARTFVERCAQPFRVGRPGFAFTDFNRWFPRSGKRVRADPDADGRCRENLNGTLFDRSALDAAKRIQGDYFVPTLRVYADTVLLHVLRSLGYPGAHVHEPLVDYRIHEGQVTGRVTYPLILDYIAATRLSRGANSVTAAEVVRLLRWMAASTTGLNMERLTGITTRRSATSGRTERR